MSLLLVIVPAIVIGVLIRRWPVVLLGPIAGAVVLGVAAAQHFSLWDTPAVFVAAVASAALALGVLLGRSGRREDSASIR